MVSIGSLMNDKDFSLKVERKKLDELCADLYTKIAGPVQKVLAETKLEVHHSSTEGESVFFLGSVVG